MHASVDACVGCRGGHRHRVVVVPLARRALVADARKVNGLTAGQIAAGIQGRVSVKTGVWSVGTNSDASVGVHCDPGTKPLSGGYLNTTGGADARCRTRGILAGE